MKLTFEKILHLVPIFKQTFLKSAISQQQTRLLLSQSQIIQSHTESVLYNQGDCIEHYFFLIQGIVGLYRSKPRQETSPRNKAQETEIVQMIQGPKNVGEFFNSLHVLREYSAVVKEDNTQVVRIGKKVFDSICQHLVVQYNQVQNYAKDNLGVNKKLNCFEIFTIKTYRLGSFIRLYGELGVIMEGQCKILVLSKPKPDQQSSPSKSNLPSIVRSSNTEVKHEVALINENQWVFTENLQEKQNDPQLKFKYVVSSSSLCLLTLPVSQIKVLPQHRVSMLMKIHHERKDRMNYQQRLSCRATLEREASNSPRGRKQQKLDEAHKILEKLDPNICPSLILKKYKLGYNSIRYENYERKERNSMVSEVEMMRKEKTERKLKKYYQSKDWSQYIKIPNAQP